MKSKKFNRILTAFIAFIIAGLAFCIGWKIAKTQTIKSARLSWVGLESYGIEYDGEEHAYYNGDDYVDMLSEWSKWYGNI